jgi:hypothetical protein
MPGADRARWLTYRTVARQLERVTAARDRYEHSWRHIGQQLKDLDTIGVVFTLLTWFFLIGAVLVLGAVLGAAWQANAEAAKPRLRIRQPT